MLTKMRIFNIFTSYLVLILSNHVSSDYFQSCEFIECSLLLPLHQTTNEISGEGTGTIMDVMRHKGLNIMADLLTKTGLANNLTDPKSLWTVFAITDEGFNELALKAPTWFQSLTTNITVTSAIMPNYIVKDYLVPYSAIRSNAFIESLGGPIFFNSIESGLGYAVNGSSRIIDDYDAINGKIYVVTNQIIEDIFSMLSFFPTTIGEDLSIFVKALEISGISKIIDDPTNGVLFTLFAPTNKAMMQAFPQGALQELMNDSSELENFLLNHILPKALFIKNDKIFKSGFLETIGGALIPFEKSADDGLVTVGENRAKILFPNRPGNNGVNHIIDQVITNSLDEY